MTAAVPYAEPARSRFGGRGGLAAALMFGGIGLIFFAGCFLVGALILAVPRFNFEGVSRPLTTHEQTLLIVCYVLAAVCLLSGFTLVFHGARAILQTLRSATY